MKVAVSNLAWHPEEDESIVSVLGRAGAEAVELAPGKVWPDPVSVPAAEARQARSWWEDRGLPVVALQALLFGRPDLQLFGPGAVRRELGDRLRRLCELAAHLGASVLVFGSPRNRARGETAAEEAFDIAVRFFADVGLAARSCGVVVCIEPNPPVYGCNFVTDVDEAIALVDAVGSPGFGLHFDTACVTLAGQDVGPAVVDAGSRIRHVHVSEPDLGPVGSPTGKVDHEAVARSLRAVGYEGFASIEMLPASATDNGPAVAAALDTVRSVYG
jgi:D-psicose/D-tagatose/L-ribulose 3-epimerase